MPEQSRNNGRRKRADRALTRQLREAGLTRETLEQWVRDACAPRPGDAEARLVAAYEAVDPYAPGARLRATDPAREEIRRAFEWFEPLQLFGALQALDGEAPSSPFGGVRADRGDRADYRAAADAVAWLDKRIAEAEQAAVRFSGSEARLIKLRDARATLEREAEGLADRIALREALAAEIPSARQRLIQFLRRIGLPLREHDKRFWTWERVASLVLLSGNDWSRRPCPALVIELEDSDLSSLLKQYARAV